MDEMQVLCHTLEQVMGALLTAMRAGDVATVAQLAQGRTPLIAAFLERWDTLSIAEQEQLAPSLVMVLSLDGETIALGRAWQRDAIQRLSQMQRGTITLKGYGAPFSLLHVPRRQ
ncbi:MAG TPA: hypothetical protein VKB76_15920 [Ktedonobacterales bacterium]|nr:hypothetical protein [Ktedonobacterales bacterium]